MSRLVTCTITACIFYSKNYCDENVRYQVAHFITVRGNFESFSLPNHLLFIMGSTYTREEEIIQSYDNHRQHLRTTVPDL